MPDPPLTDGFVRLRPFEMGDVEDVTRACQDRQISRWTDAVPWPYDEDHARRWISAHPGQWDRGELAPFAIVGAGHGDFLGAMSLSFPADRPPVAGYWVADWGRNRGVATAALTVITTWGFDTLGLPSIRLATMHGNVASERVARKAAFVVIDEASDYRPPGKSEHVYSAKLWERTVPPGTA